MVGPDDRAIGPGALLAEVFRGGARESWHRGSIAVVKDDELWWGAGDPRERVWARSAIKPLQALPLCERGVVERLELGARELAVISASHDGTSQHVEVVRELLERGGFSEDDLRCGPHAPFDKRSGLAIARRGGKPQRIHNNCSGKHAGFLLLAHECGVAPPDYLDPSSLSQREVHAAVAQMCGIDADSIDVAVDGCGAPTLRLPLDGLARGFARLMNPDRQPDVRAAACRRLLDAITAEPFYLAGRERPGTLLVRSASGRIYPKNGAEGVFAFGAATQSGIFGAAIKVHDGAERGYLPAVVELARRLGLWPDAPAGEVPATLKRFAKVPVLNTQKLQVGEVRSAVDWSRWPSDSA